MYNIVQTVKHIYVQYRSNDYNSYNTYIHMHCTILLNCCVKLNITTVSK